MCYIILHVVHVTYLCIVYNEWEFISSYHSIEKFHLTSERNLIRLSSHTHTHTHKASYHTMDGGAKRGSKLWTIRCFDFKLLMKIACTPRSESIKKNHFNNRKIQMFRICIIRAEIFIRIRKFFCFDFVKSIEFIKKKWSCVDIYNDIDFTFLMMMTNLLGNVPKNNR